MVPDAEQLLRYVERFRDVYLEQADKVIPTVHQQRLQKYAYLRMRLVVHVGSTGWGWEAMPGPPNIVSREYDRPIDIAVARADRRSYRSPSLRDRTSLVPAPDSTAISMKDSSNLLVIANRVSGFAVPIRFTNTNCDYTVIETEWNTHHDIIDYVFFLRVFGDADSRPFDEASAAADATAEVYQALVDIERSQRKHVSLAEFLKTFKERTVLVLGSFRQREVLEQVKSLLADHGYDPVLLDELPEHEAYDLKQKFLAVASVARFVIFEDSDPSGHLIEMGLADTLEPIRVVLRPRGSPPSTYMTALDEAKSTVIRSFEYDPDELAGTVVAAVEWAEGRNSALAAIGRELLPWRNLDVLGEAGRDVGSE